VTLTWIAAPLAQNYKIYRASGASPTSFTVLQTVSQGLGVLATNATVSGLAPGQTYYFQVRAVDQTGFETIVPASVIIAGGTAGFLPPPGNLVVIATTSNAVSLSWTASSGATTYNIYQRVSTANTPAVLSAASNVSSNGATVTNLASGTTYYFFVVAKDSLNRVSGPSNQVTATTAL
jgi:fibronectin type 3 domain-containing protein